MKKILFLVLFVIASIGVHGQIPSYMPVTGLIAWYPFTGNPNDSSGGGNNGVAHGGVTYGTDRFGVANSCYQGDSTSGIDIPLNHFPIGNMPRSVSVFFKLDSPYATRNRELIGWGNNSVPGERFGIVLNEGVSIGWESVGAGVDTAFTPDTFWHNITVTYAASGLGSSDIKIYFDGHIAGTTIIYPMSSLNTDTGYIHCIGTLDLDPGFLYSWNGKLDDIAIWNRELTSCEVETMYYGPNPISPKIIKTGMVLTTDTTYISYQWIKNDTPITGATSYSYTGTSGGAYKIAVVTPGGCPDTSLVDSIKITTFASNIPIADDINIYPNPTGSIVHIQSPIKINIVLSNVIGKILFKEDNANELDLCQLPDGIYLLSIFDENENKIKTERISKLSQ